MKALNLEHTISLSLVPPPSPSWGSIHHLIWRQWSRTELHYGDFFKAIFASEREREGQWVISLWRQSLAGVVGEGLYCTHCSNKDRVGLIIEMLTLLVDNQEHALSTVQLGSIYDSSTHISCLYCPLTRLNSLLFTTTAVIIGFALRWYIKGVK